jgi:hypothetical protein
MARDNAIMTPDDAVQLRAEVALLRAQVTEFQAQARETAAQKEAHARYLEWVGKSAQEKTQLAADAKYGDPSLGDWWTVSLPEMPTVRVRAHSEYEAIGRYNAVIGCTSTVHKYTAAPASEGGNRE